jgi:hypothetical protein
MADFDLGGFTSALFGGDTPNIGESIPSGGFNLGDLGLGGSGSSSLPGGGLNFNLGGSAGLPMNDWLSSFEKSLTPGVSSPMPGNNNNGGDWFSNISKGLDKYMTPVAGLAKAISPLVGLGTAGAGIGNAIMGMQQGRQGQQAVQQAMGTERDISRAALPAATNLVNAGSTAMLGGPLTPGIQAQVDDFKRRSKAEINSYLSHAGIADSTMMAQWDMYIEQQATLYGQQLSQNLYGQGLTGLGVAGQGASALSGSAAAYGQNVPQSIYGANQALARLAAQS